MRGASVPGYGIRFADEGGHVFIVLGQRESKVSMRVKRRSTRNKNVTIGTMIISAFMEKSTISFNKVSMINNHTIS